MNSTTVMRKTGSTLGVHIGLHNEAEILEDVISNLRATGFDHIMVSDLASTDGSRELLRRHESKDFWVLDLPYECTMANISPKKSWNYLTREFYSASYADWILFIDADEIPMIPQKRDWDTLIDSSCDAVIIKRYNTLVPQGFSPASLLPPQNHELNLVVKPIDKMREYMLNGGDMPWIMGRVNPKVIARRSKIVSPLPGCHDVKLVGDTGIRAQSNEMIIAHVPITSWSRFSRKVLEICNDFKIRKFDLKGHDSWRLQSLAWHWRRWGLIAEEGNLKSEYEKNIMLCDAIRLLHESGTVRHAKEVLKQGTKND